MTRLAALVIVGTVLPSCVVFKRKLVLPKGDSAAVLLVSTEMPHPIDKIARHGWFAVRKQGSTKWRRIEVGSFGKDPFDGISGVELHAVWTGKKAQRAIACLEKHRGKARPGRGYLPWPGPNSNTFVDILLRKCNLHADLPPTAIGKDYRGWLGGGVTSGGTGLQLETPLIGIKLGLTEGLELHLFGLAIGVDWWPPAIIVPLGSGRIGFADR